MLSVNPKNSSISFALFLSLIHSRRFILNLKKKNKLTSNQLTFTPKKLTLLIIKSTSSWDRHSSPPNLFYNRLVHLRIQ